MQTVDRLRQRLPLLIDPPSDDICYATQNRQAAVKTIAPRCDVVIVVGSENSSNSVFAEVAEEAGARAYRIDDAEQVDWSWVQGLRPWASPPAPAFPNHWWTNYWKRFQCTASTTSKWSPRSRRA